MSEWGSQCVLATHSLAFITPSPHLQAYQLARIDEPDSTEITPLNPATLTPYAQLAHDLGLDRGELLTRWRAFVFTDPLLALILDELAGEAFEQSDIRLIPLPAPGAHHEPAHQRHATANQQAPTPYPWHVEQIALTAEAR